MERGKAKKVILVKNEFTSGNEFWEQNSCKNFREPNLHMVEKVKIGW